MGRRNKTIEMEVGDLYQMMVAECRYGYTRNNHLMPDGAFGHVRKYLSAMEKADREFAECTASQLADEAISELTMRFPRKEEAAFTVYVSGIDGVRSVEAEWTMGVNVYSVSFPFKAKAGVKFSLWEDDILWIAEEGGKLLMKREWGKYGYSMRVYEPNPEKEGWYDSVPIPEKGAEVEEGKDLLIIVDKDLPLSMSLYCGFIDYLLKFLKDMDSSREPYNIEDYRRFLKEHPRTQAEAEGA